jgi:DNA-binding GntR family transcriptional regulator
MSKQITAKGETAVDTAASTVERVIEFIKDGIKAGRFVPGQRLVEPDLIEMLKVGRSSLREALHRLSASGFVELQQFRGARVRLMSRADVLELNEIRAVLEGYAAGSAAERADAESRKALKNLEREIGIDAVVSVEQYSEYNTRFHDLIIAMGGHNHLAQFVDQTRLSVFRLQFDFLLLTPERMKISRAEHQVIAKAIIGGDPAAADGAMRKHIGHSTSLILSAPRQYLSD